jgi:serpin B
MKHVAGLVALCLWGGVATYAEVTPDDPAPVAINALGCDLLAQSEGNALLSPFSIQTALGMTYAGAAGATRADMARVLHFRGEEDALHASFAALQAALEDIARVTAERAEQARRAGGGGDPVVLTVANRLFGQKEYEFRPTFLDLVGEVYGAPLQPADFRADARGETTAINRWVETQTRDRIRNLIPDGALTADTRLVLVNAVYLKAPWEEEFPAFLTKPTPFRVAGGDPVKVPTLQRTGYLGYQKGEGYTAVSVPYRGRFLDFLVLVPDQPDGLADLEKNISPEFLAACASLPGRDVTLFLPKFRLEPPLLKLSDTLKKLGLRSAFNEPPGSADFDRMAPRRPDDYLYISEIFHKTFLALDEKGTEAAAATAVAMMRATSAMMEKPKPVEVRVDRPFLFAIQHRASGACLFLGRMNDPR